MPEVLTLKNYCATVSTKANNLREERMKGLTVTEAAKELGTSTRTIFRMIRDGRLKAEKVDMPYGNEKFIWMIDPMSIARIQVRKEMGVETRRRNKKNV